MAIKTEATAFTPRGPTYPRLKIDPRSKQIVLFTGCATGFVVSPVLGGYSVGHNSSIWAESTFDDYTGVVTLANAD